MSRLKIPLQRVDCQHSPLFGYSQVIFYNIKEDPGDKEHLLLSHMTRISGLFFFFRLKWYMSIQPTFSESWLYQTSCQPFPQRLKMADCTGLISKL